MSYTTSQRYLSTRGGSYNLSFEEVVLKGLASDGGLFIPESLPLLPQSFLEEWRGLSFQDLAYNILSLYISPSEIPSSDLKNLIHKSYSTFRDEEITPLITLDPSRQIHLLELFHGPTFAFKDVALQFLGNLFEYFLVRRNKSKAESQRDHLTVVGATSGDTGSAAIYGLRGKKDVSIFIMFPTGKVSPIQEAQMTSVLDANVHNLSVDGTFDDCQDFVKALFADPEINETHRLAAVNSINWARILAQITYYFHAYFQLVKRGNDYKEGHKVRFVVPTGNFGDILAGYFALRMGLPIERLVVATNENDILHRFWQTGRYEKKPAAPEDQAGLSVNGSSGGGFAKDGAKAHEDGAKETLSPAMDILVSSNFERLLWFLSYQVHGLSEEGVNGGADEDERRAQAGRRVKGWLGELKANGGFAVGDEILKAARVSFESERVSDQETLSTIRDTYTSSLPPLPPSTSVASRGGPEKYILDPHSAVGVAASLRSSERNPVSSGTHHISLSTAHPAKFSSAVEKALEEERDFKFDDLLPEQFKDFKDAPRRVTMVKKEADGLVGIRGIIQRRVPTSFSAVVASTPSGPAA